MDCGKVEATISSPSLVKVEMNAFVGEPFPVRHQAITRCTGWYCCSPVPFVHATWGPVTFFLW